MAEVLERLNHAQYRGVRGVLEVDSGIAGVTAAILACTHGNEPAGLQAIHYLSDDLQLKKGRVLFILVNPEAARKSRRYIDFNMNRIPASLSLWEGSSEGARIQELLPILQEINGGVLDIHSTSAVSPPMLIAIDEAGLAAAYEPHSPFEHIITGIESHLRGQFVIEQCLQAKVRLLAECGQHLCPAAGSRAIDVSLSFLYHLGMIDAPPWPIKKQSLQHYHVEYAMRLPPCEVGYRLEKPLSPFEWVEKGQAIACNGVQKAITPQSGYAIMCPETEEVLDANEALLFLCEQRNR